MSGNHLLAFYLYWYCVCSPIIGKLFFAETSFFQVYRPLTFACLAVLQFLMVLGKKKYVNLKTTCGVSRYALELALSLLLQLFQWCTTVVRESFATTILSQQQATVWCWCYHKGLHLHFCGLLPSLVVVIISSMWSCVVFKNYYMHRWR